MHDYHLKKKGNSHRPFQIIVELEMNLSTKYNMGEISYIYIFH